MNAIEINNISFAYQNEKVLDEVTLHIPENEFVGIIGPNGGGKTTLIKLILGLLKPQIGSIKIFGLPPYQARHLMGYVPQYATCNRNFPISVLDTVLMGRLGQKKPLDKKHDQNLCLELLAMLEIEHLKDRRINELSGGQMQRLLIARALACQPKILVLDEPTGNIDPHMEKNIFDFLKQQNQHLTIITVSHDVGFITQYIQRVACLNKKLVCHATEQLDGMTIKDLYATSVHAIHHDHRMSEE